MSGTFPLRPRRTIALLGGTASTTVIAACSYVLAPLGSAAALWQTGWFPALRQSQSAAVWATILLTVSVFALLGCWLLLARSGGRPLQLRTVATAAAAWAAPLLIALPLTSRDVYSYIALGELVRGGYNPYTSAVSILPQWQSLGVDPVWADTVTPYGPTLIALSWLVVTVTQPLGLLGAIAGFRILMAAALVAAAWLTVRICRASGTDPAHALWLAYANPLTLISCVLAMHNDAVIMVAVVAALAASQSGHRLVAWVGATIAIGAKPTSAIILPALARGVSGARQVSAPGASAAHKASAAHGVSPTRASATPGALARPGATTPGQAPRGYLRFLTRCAVVAAASGVAVIAGAIAWGAQPASWLSAMLSTPQQSRPLWFVPAQLVTGFSLAGAEAATPAWASALGLVFTVVGLAGAAWFTLRPSGSPRQGAALGYAAFLIGSTIIWPWYMMLLFALAAVSERAGRWMLPVTLLSVFLTGQSLAANFFDTSAMPDAFRAVFNVLPGVLGTVSALALGAGACRARQRGVGSLPS